MTHDNKVWRRRRVLQSAGVVGAGLLAGCTGGNDGSAGTTAGDATTTSGSSDNSNGGGDDTLDLAWPGGINNAHPMGWLTIPDFDTVRMMYEPLVSVDDKARPIPHIAEDWTVEDNATTYKWQIRDGITWHDGEPLTAEDVAFTFKFIKNYDWPYLGSISSALKSADSIEVTDENTVVTPLKKPYAALPLVLADLGLVVPKHVWADTENPTDAKNIDNPIGSGPFQFEDRSQDQYIEFSTFDDYWGTKPDYENAVINIIPNTDNQNLSLKKGKTDVTRLAPSPTVDDVKKADGVDTVSAGSTYIRYIAFQTNEKPFDDKAVRKAVAYAINRDPIIKLVMGGYAEKATSVIASGLEYYHNPDVPAYDHDLEEAKRLLSENGYEMNGDVRVTPDGEKMEYELPIQNTGSWPRLANLVKRQLKKVGINLDVVSMESNSYTDRVTVNHDFKITVSDWRLWFDPDPFLSPSFEQDGSLNYAEYQNDEFDELMEKQRAAADAEERKEYLYKAQEIIAEDVPWYTMFYPNLLHAVNSNQWTNTDPIPRYGMQSAYGHEAGTGPLVELDNK